MRTPAEIVVKYEARKAEALMFDFFPDVIVLYLTFDQAKSFMNFEKVTEGEARESWKPDVLTEEAVLAEMKDYMEFAWGKAQDHRGLSANRSIQKLEAWAWLAECDDAIDWENYAQYGAPILKQLSELLDFPIPSDQNLQRMMVGLPCSDDCSGCG